MGGIPSMAAPPPSRIRKFDRTLIEGPILHGVWKLAWPTMLQNGIAGLQGIVDHALVGHFVGYHANAAIGVSWQIFLVVVVFVSSMFSGMAVMVARFAGAGEHDKVNRVVYQAILMALIMAFGVLAPIGYVLSPSLLELVNASAPVKALALPYLRTMFVYSIGMLMFFLLGGAFRAAGDAKTPLMLGVVLTALNLVLNIILIPGLGPVPPLGTLGAALGTVIAGGVVGLIGLAMLFSDRCVISFSRNMRWTVDWDIVRKLFQFGLPTGFQGVAMNIAGVMLLRYIGSLDVSAEAQAAYAVGYTELFALVTWTSVGLMGATATMTGQNLGAGQPERARRAASAAARIGLTLATAMGALFLLIPRQLYAIFGTTESEVLNIGVELLWYLSASGFFITVALTYTGALQGAGDTRSPFFISVISQIVVPLGLCFVIDSTRGLRPADIWLAIVIGHLTRCILSYARFRQEKWRAIAVDIAPART
jgi:putative MATE family efflux protein